MALLELSIFPLLCAPPTVCKMVSSVEFVWLHSLNRCMVPLFLHHEKRNQGRIYSPYFPHQIIRLFVRAPVSNYSVKLEMQQRAGKTICINAALFTFSNLSACVLLKLTP